MSVEFSVLGGGLVGRLMALQLARHHYSVALYERGDAEGSASAAYVAAAMLAPLAESLIAEPLIVQLGLRSLQRWPEILSTFSHPVFFQQNGTLLVWHSQDREQATHFTARLHRLYPTIYHDHDPHYATSHVREVHAREIAELEPSLASRFSRGLFLPGEGQLDNRALLKALVYELEKEGVSLHWHSEANPDSLASRWIIDCRGLGAKGDWTALRGVRGEVIRVSTTEVQLSRPVRLLHPRYPLYIAPKPNGVYVIGATQIETEDFSPISVRSTLELLSALYSVHPAFAEARLIETASQCRPTLPDHLPALNWNGKRLIQINGLYRHGYLIAPALLDAAMALIQYVLDPQQNETWETWRNVQMWPDLYRKQ